MNFYKLVAPPLLLSVLTACQSLTVGKTEAPTEVQPSQPEVTEQQAKPVLPEKQLIVWSEEDQQLYDSYQEYQPYKLDARQIELLSLKLRYPDDIWADVRAGLQFDLDVDNKRIQSQLAWYARHPKYMNRVSQRASRYMQFVMEEIRKRNMPTEFALLPIVESAYDPFAYSHGRASGMWQFIPSTGRIYGLEQTWWYDGRRDVVASTRAALDFLENLKNRFGGNWDLALAAYNSGAGNVSKAIRRNKKKGLPTDFWSLKLPKETQAYVPKMYALAKLIKDPSKYNLQLAEITRDPYFEVVDVGSQIDLAQAAALADIDLNELYLLNPGYNQWATSPEGPHYLLIPTDNAPLFKQRLTKIPDEDRLTWKRYSIKSGDSLITIAKKFHTTVQVIRDVNNIRGNTIVAGKTLLIPVASKSLGKYAMSADQRLNRKQNSKPSNNASKTSYTVRSGDTLWDISRKYNVSVQKLAKWNGMAPKDMLKNGQKLVIWTTADKKTSSSPANRQIIRKVGYKVRKGDSLYKIANKFNTSVAKIKKWNSLNQKYLQPGQHITLYVDVTRIN